MGRDKRGRHSSCCPWEEIREGDVPPSARRGPAAIFLTVERLHPICAKCSMGNKFLAVAHGF
jgi:hypothetical protein